jgi:ABC-type nickel/cobalt efflux system permease component RcnA
MRRAVTYAGLVLVALGGLLWLTGALGPVADGLQVAQRTAQERLAGAIRSLRGGEPGALAAFWAVCFGYGVLHAAGPGHGKLVIGGYGVARRVPVGRLAGLALASSLAQAAVAVGLVYAALAVLGLTRTAVEGAAEHWVTPVGHAMILGLGLWLVWRGLQGMRGMRSGAAGHGPHGHHQTHDHDHHPHDHVHGPQCNHAHGPTVEEVERVGSWRDGLALVTGIALRPCSGALFVLVLTWQLGIALAGVAGAFVMGLGTAVVTVAAALLAVWAREGAFAGLGSDAVARAMPVIQLAVGAVIAVAAGGLLIQSL